MDKSKTRRSLSTTAYRHSPGLLLLVVIYHSGQPYHVAVAVGVCIVGKCMQLSRQGAYIYAFVFPLLWSISL